MTRFSYGFYPPQSQRPRVTAHNRRGRVRPGCHVVCHQMAPWTRRALQQPGRFCEPPSCASTSWVTGPNLGTGYLKCQGTMQRHSDILEKEAQPPREESKEIVKKNKKTGGIGRDKALLKPESNPISLQFSSGRTDMTQVILFAWYCATGWLHFALNWVCEPTPALTSNRQPGRNKNRPLHCSVDILKEFPVPRPSDDFFRSLPRKLFFPPLLSKKPRNHRQMKTSYQVKVIFK